LRAAIFTLMGAARVDAPFPGCGQLFSREMPMPGGHNAAMKMGAARVDAPFPGCGQLFSR
jgi:hypothetical protein